MKRYRDDTEASANVDAKLVFSPCRDSSRYRNGSVGNMTGLGPMWRSVHRVQPYGGKILANSDRAVVEYIVN